MLARWIIVGVYSIGVTLFFSYVYLVGLFSEMWVDETLKFHFEYIIVGAGTAGLTVAAGLNSDSVLILEAGGYTTDVLDIPVVTPLLQTSTFDWKHHTSRQTHACRALKEQRSRWPAGRGFGGSQILNYMMWTRGYPEDYRGWFSDAANFDYEKDVEPYFDKSERDLNLSELGHQTMLAQAFVNASKQYGYESQDFYIPRVTQLNGKRWTTAHRLRAKPRFGHHIYTYSQVTALLFDESSKQVSGVVYERNCFTFTATALKGVILSAGTLGSPMILQQSGIGPESFVKNLTVELRHALPVGQNLQDHVTTGVDLIMVNQPLGVRPWEVLSVESLFKYFMHGTGPLSMCGCEALGFANTGNGSTPDLGFMVLPMGVSADGGAHFRYLLNIDDQVWNDYFDPLIGHHTVSILPIVLHPKSRGYVQREGDHIVINPNYLTDRHDVDTLVKGLRIIEQLLEMPALKKLGAEINPKPMPGCGHLVFRSTPYWECYVRHLTLTAFHPVGTCRMGDANDPAAVVNREFQVLGVDNLWVVDASVMPNLPSGNPNAVVAMLANRFLATFNRRAAASALPGVWRQ